METLKKIAVPTKDQVNEESQVIFDQLKSKLGMVPNLYATIGYSSNALSSYLTYSNSAGKGSFTTKEKEAIMLAVSEVNNCDYCKSAHTAIAKMNGFTQEETVQLRQATIEDERLNALTSLAKEVAEKAGHVSDEAKQRFFDQGFDEKALIDFVSVVTAITFTNYVHSITDIEIDFPLVQ